MSTMTQVTTMAGFASGRTIRHIICASFAPSIFDASSISTGMESKYPFMFQTAKTHMLPAYMSISPMWEFSKPGKAQYAIIGEEREHLREGV